MRSDALAIGVMLAWVETFRRELLPPIGFRAQSLLLVLGLVLLLPAFAFDLEEMPLFMPFGYSVYPLAGTLLIIGSPALAAADGVAMGLIGWIGARSYSLYLWHLPVYSVVWSAVGTNSWMTGTILSIVLSLVTGVLMAEVVELPSVAWRDRVVRSGLGGTDGATGINPARRTSF